MSTMYDKIRAMLNSNGRTPEEAETFRAKAEELAEKHGYAGAFREDLKAAKAKASANAKKKASKGKKGKAKADGTFTFKPKAAPKAPDNRMRQILLKNVDTGRWSPLQVISKANLKMAMKDLRERGYTVKSKVIN